MNRFAKPEPESVRVEIRWGDTVYEVELAHDPDNAPLTARIDMDRDVYESVNAELWRELVPGDILRADIELTGKVIRAERKTAERKTTAAEVTTLNDRARGKRVFLSGDGTLREVGPT